MVKHIENYALYEIIGSGADSKVYRAVTNLDKVEYAVKVIPVFKFKSNKKIESRIANEIRILRNMENNLHIMRYYDTLKTINNFYFVYEYCNGGTLQGLLAREKKLPEPQALLIFRQILDAFQILNKQNITHRGLEPDNIFFHNGIIKLGDFGVCKDSNFDKDMAETMTDLPIYMAPEVLKGEINSNKADIWSLGVILYEMLFGFCPFQSSSIANLIKVLNTQNLAFPASLSPLIRNLIQRMLTKDPLQRIDWMELFQININNEGYIEENKTQQKIYILSEDKTSNEPSSLESSSKVIISQNEALLQNPSNNNEQSVYTNSNFKKTTTLHTCIDESQQAQKISDSNFVGQQHRTIIEAIQLSLEISQSRMPNSLGYSFLLLNKAAQQAQELAEKCARKDYSQILQKQAKQIKIEKDLISNKMFPYELKDLDDWRNYLRGKFFEDEKTISLWYKMVIYLHGSKVQLNLNDKTMAESIENILYRSADQKF